MATHTNPIDPQWAWSAYEPDAAAPWNARRAAHLYRRAMFGASWDTIQQAVGRSPADIVREMIEKALTPTAEFDALEDSIAATGQTEQLAASWLYRMLFTATPLLEMLTLFWHGHFATSDAKVRNTRLMLAQNRCLRQHALGSFHELVAAISRDPAMLIYLDSATNRKSHPNENYARELMELFCLGEGHYTESDIREVARCFTGWEVRNDAFRYNRFQYDRQLKSVFGRRDHLDGDAVIELILQQPAAPHFIAKKLIRWLIMDEPEPSEALVAPVAGWLVDAEWQIAPVVARLLTSRLFFSEYSMARKVRSPIELVVGFLRSLNGTTDTTMLADRLRRLGHAVYFPPNVKGWEGGRRWIDSASVLGRANLIRAILEHEATRFGGGRLEAYLPPAVMADAESLVDRLSATLCAVPLSRQARTELVQVAGRSQPGEPVDIVDLLGTMVALPEFQLG